MAEGGDAFLPSSGNQGWSRILPTGNHGYRSPDTKLDVLPMVDGSGGSPRLIPRESGYGRVRVEAEDES